MTMGPFLLLHSKDNVLVARALAPEGAEIVLEGGRLRLSKAIPMAHKIARHPIAAGAVVVKYGAPIGVALVDIPAGAHVHIHNIRSGYTPSVALQDGDGQMMGGQA